LGKIQRRESRRAALPPFFCQGELKKRWRMIATVYILVCMKADRRLGLCVEPAIGEWN
jgi:hypothetical protein